GLKNFPIPNRPPFAAASATPNTAIAVAGGGPEITLSASGSSDPDFDLLQYQWGLPAGATLRAGEHVTDKIIHVKFPAGTWTVTLNVTDSVLASSSASATVTILAAAPPPALVLPGNITAEATIAPSGALPAR